MCIASKAFDNFKQMQQGFMLLFLPLSTSVSIPTPTFLLQLQFSYLELGFKTLILEFLTLKGNLGEAYFMVLNTLSGLAHFYTFKAGQFCFCEFYLYFGILGAFLAGSDTRN
ncbi:unnamed protein product [Cyclocybe aegerita]|uniref:Uncharacterized protein n=1 Tax=Cyclocybe aegerita TaxID=1973307 RepID=A0A8S0W1B6_CYCAE|nr:unnamed protein product [Cyclocybe aegerita]